jgi:protein O-mannosyl-transferase
VPLVKIFETPVSNNYHPITILSLAFNYQHGKLAPFGYHLENVIFHVLNTILVFFFIFLLTRRNLLMAVIVSLFFGIHPMHVESVTWVSERKDVLYVFFFIAGLITYLRYSETKKITWYYFTLLLFILSCLSKGMAVVFPVILLLIDYLQGVKWERRLLLEKIPFFLISMIFGIVTIKTQTGQNIATIKSFTVFQHLMFASYGAIVYIVKLLAPYKLSAFYPYPIGNRNSSVPLIFYLSPFISFVILTALIYFFRRKEKEIVFGLLFYFVTVALVLQFIPIGAAIMADRYSYLSYIGLLFVVAYIINKVWQNKSGILVSMKYPVMVIVIIGIVVFSYQTYSRTQIWKNSNVLWTDVIDNYDNIPLAYYDRGLFYSNSDNKKDSAMADFNKAIALDSTYSDPYNNRGLLYLNDGKIDLAMTDFNKAIEFNSIYADAYNNLGLLYLKTGKTDLALANCNKAIALDSTIIEAYNNRGLLYLNAGKGDLAMADFSKALALDSTSAEVFNNIGLLYLRYGKNDLAIADFNKALALNPASAMYYYNRGLCYKGSNQYEKALNDFTNGIQLNPKSIELYYNMSGICNVNLQNYKAAIADFSKAIEINPFVADYWLKRSFIEGKTGQSENAKADALKAQQLQAPHP